MIDPDSGRKTWGNIKRNQDFEVEVTNDSESYRLNLGQIDH
jgi:hypothetical protein